MTNEYIGETPVVLGGKQYTLRLTTNRLAIVEALLDCRSGLSARLLGGGLETLRAVFYVCLTTPEKKGLRPAIQQPFSIEDMGALVDESGGALVKGPVSIAYWELMCNNGIADRAMAEAADMIPARKGPKEAPPAAVVQDEEEPVAIGSI
jgi:hypothetical protein